MIHTDAIVETETAGDTGAHRAAMVRSALAGFRHGRADPTTRLVSSPTGGRFLRATWTPDGPGTVHIAWWSSSPAESIRLDAEAAGPGADWLLARVDAMIGRSDLGAPELERAPHQAVAQAARAGRNLRFGRSDDLYHELLPTAIEQRITIGAALRQWSVLCVELGQSAPGDHPELSLPPSPDRLRRCPTWWFHPLGIERKRAATLVEIARHADRLWEWSTLGADETAARLRLLRGVGPWTVGSVLGPALGDPDALCVGDYHAKNVVAWALHGRPRGTDDEMLESLRPYRGQRGRVLRLLRAAGHRAPAFGPKRAVLPMERW